MYEITTSPIHYEADGLSMVGHLAVPKGEGPWPAVLLAHDGVGLDPYQRSRADALAAHGYIAFALDFHGGATFFGRPQAMLARTLPLLADEDRMRAIGRIALDLLRSTPEVDSSRLFALGYGAGSRILLELAKTGTSFQAIAAIHPALPRPSAQDWLAVKSTILLCTGSKDPIVPPAQLLTFGQALEEAGADWRLTIYGGAQHAFWARPMNDDGSPIEGSMHVQATVPGVGYHPEHTERAWRAVLDLFGEEGK